MSCNVCREFCLPDALRSTSRMGEQRERKERNTTSTGVRIRSPIVVRVDLQGAGVNPLDLKIRPSIVVGRGLRGLRTNPPRGVGMTR